MNCLNNIWSSDQVMERPLFALIGGVKTSDVHMLKNVVIPKIEQTSVWSEHQKKIFSSMELQKFQVLNCVQISKEEQGLVMPLSVPKPQSTHRHHRVDALWDHNADKYRVVCRSIHVMKATQYIGYAQLIIIGMFTTTLLFFYGRQINGSLPADHWLSSAGGRYLTSLLTAVSLQLSLVLMMLHGVRSQRRSFLLPFIIFAAFAVFLAFIQVSSDIIAASQQRAGAASGVQLLSHVMGMFVHIWCVAVVWRCYCFLGDKKVADRIAEQLQTTSMAFAYDYTQPPPYADTIIEKHPLTIA